MKNLLNYPKNKGVHSKSHLLMRTPQVLIAVLITFLIISCNKNDSHVTPQDFPSKERIIKPSEAENKNNPMDDAGAMHNEFVGKVADAGGDVSETQLRRITADFLHGEDKEEVAKILDNFHEIYVAASSNMPKIGGPYQQFFCEEYPWICQIFNPSPTFPFMVFDNSDKSATDQTLDFISAVKEKEAQESSSLESGRRNMILAMYSITRYSAIYWHNNSVDGHTTFPEAAMLKDPRPVIVADVKGFVDGYNWGGFLSGVVWGSIKSVIAAAKLQTNDSGETGTEIIDEKAAANSLNKLDTVGKMHNAFIEFYSEKYNSVTKENLREALGEFFKNDKSEDTKLVLAQFDDIYKGVEASLALIGNDRPFNPEVWSPCRYLPDWVCDILYPNDPLPLMMLTNGGGDQYQHSLAFINQVKNIETQVLDKTMKEDQQSILLCAYSVARYSTTHWYNAMTVSGETDDAQPLSMDKGTVLADIAGAGVGATIGSKASFWGGIIGAVVGGVIGSVAYHYAS